MVEDYFRQYGLITLFAGIAVLVPIGMLMTSYMATKIKVRPRRPSPVKLETYECGFGPIGGKWSFNSRYYTFALLFVIFDVETVFLYPWAVKFGVLSARFGIFALVEVAVFGIILAIGWGYAWRKKALEWT
ncbi:MAG: NADH-quinone oxidoreductase subunit A [Chloroflexi bacterium]|nr:NADH-quinone oxidoreductase subunit A [Chloroflexota bacterium]